MVNTSNLCTFEGRISREPQYSTVQIGQDTVQKALFSIAVDRALSSAQRQKVRNGDQSIKTCDFIPCSLLGAQVDTLRQYFPVGKAIKVIGHYTEYQTKDQQTGQVKYGHMFELDHISFTTQDSKNLQQNQGGQQQAPAQPNQYAQQQYQQPQQQYQQTLPQNYQQTPQSNFTMFDENQSPF